LLRAELEEFARQSMIKLTLTVDKIGEGEKWEGHFGYLTKEVLQNLVGQPDAAHGLFYCGPPPMNQFVGETLAQLGHHAENITKY
jgi:NAD(P)H-flavin reductase